MYGLCQQCQLYYPMPPDFGEGVAYACPECGTVLVPFEPEAPAPAAVPEEPAAPAVPEAWFDMPEDEPAEVPDERADPSPEEVPPAPAVDVPAPDLETAHEAALDDEAVPPAAGVRVLWFHPRVSAEVEAARGAPPPPASAPPPPQTPAEEALPAPAEEAPRAPAEEASPARPDRGDTTFLYRGAGEGVAREELPVTGASALPRPEVRVAVSEPPRPRVLEADPRQRRVTVASATRPRRRPARALGWLAALLLLAGAGGGLWALHRAGRLSLVPWLPGDLAAAPPAARGAAPASEDVAPVPVEASAPEEAVPVPADVEAPAPTEALPEAAAQAPAAAETPPPGGAGGPDVSLPPRLEAEAAVHGPLSAAERSAELVGMAHELMRSGRVDQAILHFERALLLDERNAQAHRGLGVAYAQDGRLDAAAREYELYLRLAPDAPDAPDVRQIIDAYYAQVRRP